MTLTLISCRAGLAFSMWIFVLLKQRAILLFWIPLSVITDSVFIGHLIINHPRDFVSDEMWIFNIFSLFIFRLYVTAVMFQALTRLLRNARLKSSAMSNSSSNASECSTSFKYYLVEPIGKNPLNICRYYDKIPRLGAAVLVAYEIVSYISYKVFSIPIWFIT